MKFYSFPQIPFTLTPFGIAIPAQPGSIPAAPAPGGIILPGAPGSLQTDFRSSTGLWNNILEPSRGKTLSFNPITGAMTIAVAGPRVTAARMELAGANSRFCMLPDLTGALQWRVRLKVFTLSGNVAGSKCGLGFVVRNFVVGANITHMYVTGPIDATANRVGYMIGSVNSFNLTGYSFSDSGTIGAAGTIATLDIRSTLTFDETAAPPRLRMKTSSYSLNGAAYTPIALGSPAEWGFTSYYGSSIYLGYCNVGSTDVMQATITEFEIEAGYLSLGRL
jgi:hypothetical protein